ncbi:MAG: M6 family metalloprotease domain-containing protein [Candidatus Delongbacteria bacterium]|nr:M6 family metalloprotease domain-containing protein [Candidatus Delongbacteria bacterium]MBN2836502.1 M6 family metalloprotease domain-containing protein [Candidatus Delongbacteria bacterium]
MINKVIILLLISLSIVISAPISFQEYSVNQPDGTEIKCYVSGDEFFNYIHDADGYTIIQNDDGWYYYGISIGDKVVPSKHKVGEVTPSATNLKKWDLISKDAYQKRRDFYNFDGKLDVKAPHEGVLNNVVVYIKFADDTEFPEPRSLFDDRLNKENSVSLRDYYNEVSYNKLEIISHHYPESALNTNISFTDENPRDYYRPYSSSNPIGYTENQRTSREHKLLKRAIEAIAPQVPTNLDIDADNDGNVDNVCFIIRGGNDGWAELLWAHRWYLYTENAFINGKKVYDYTFQPVTQNNVQTLCHEMFHALGAPDLYHYYENTNISPAGPWDLMESGFGHMGSYMKWKYADQTWIEEIPEITESGEYTLYPLSNESQNCFKIQSPNSNHEFFVLEYRKRDSSYEGNLPGSGLLVYRINTYYDGNADGDDEVYIYRPNGTPTNNGSINQAFYSYESGRVSIDDTTNPTPFLENGNFGGLYLYNIGTAGETITFNVTSGYLAPPQNLFGSADDGICTLSWESGVKNFEYYNVYRNDEVIGTTNENNYVDESVNNGTEYVYTISAVYSGEVSGESAKSNEVVLIPYASLVLPFSEDFESPSFWWTSNVNCQDKWDIRNTNKAGGSAPEIRNQWQNGNDNQITRYVSPRLNTTGIDVLHVNFKQYFKFMSGGVTLKIQSSTDGVNFTDEDWIKTPEDDLDASSEYCNINIVGDITYIAFTIEGNLLQYGFWYFDDIEIGEGAEINETVPETTILLTSYPNPFNPVTNLLFNSSFNNQKMTLNIYNSNGQKVFADSNLTLTKGVNIVRFDASSLNSGVYYAQIKGSKISSNLHKIVLLK